MGTLLTGLFADDRAYPGVNGSFYGGDKLVGHHIAALVCVGVACAITSFILCKVCVSV